MRLKQDWADKQYDLPSLNSVCAVGKCLLSAGRSAKAAAALHFSPGQGMGAFADVCAGVAPAQGGRVVALIMYAGGIAFVMDWHQQMGSKEEIHACSAT